ncbi:MAG TPA: hypothetical protein VLI69_03110 [Gammaproteobacteria bacterium]|nr:hypothetical protein [Gammaproteobacteria bacterium]
MNLENRLFYRLVNVMYYFSVIIFCLIAVFIVINVGFWWGTLIAGISYSIINICKESLIYVAFGKKISWEWLLNIKKIFLTIANYQNKKLKFTLSEIAEIPSNVLFTSDGMLCYDWKPCSASISEELHNTAWYASIAYSFYIYFLLIRNKFGNEVASVTKQHFNIFLDGKDDAGKHLQAVIGIIDFISQHHESPEVNLLVEDSYEEYKTACHFLITFPQSPYHLSNEKRSHITYGEIEEHCGESAIKTILQCFLNAKKQSIIIFKPIVEKISLQPESIKGLKIFEEIAWSSNPSCFERQLQRQFNNSLFPPKMRNIKQIDVENARKRDLDDTHKFKNEVEKYENEVKELSNRTNATFSDILSLHKKISDASSSAYGIGGNALDCLSTLTKLRTHVATILKSNAANAGSHNLIDSIDEIEASYDQCLFNNEFLQQICRENSPIKSTLVTSLLSENLESIKAICKRLSPDLFSQAKVEAIRVVKDMLARGEHHPLIKEKLIVLGVEPSFIK